MPAELRIRRTGERRTWPFGRVRAEYEIVATDGGHEVDRTTTTDASAVLAARFDVHTTDCRDWIAAADAAFQPYGESWVSGPS